MKKLLIVLFTLMSISSCQHSGRDHLQEEDIVSSVNFDWLIGSWIRNNDEEGNITYEHWDKKSNTGYTGSSFKCENKHNEFPKNIEYALLDRMPQE